MFAMVAFCGVIIVYTTHAIIWQYKKRKNIALVAGAAVVKTVAEIAMLVYATKY